jgi:murein DD-endopeptidase MepM/ murein hydrolase activator NlpD
MTWLLTLAAALVSATQGQAVELVVPVEPGLEAVQAQWDEHQVPFFRRGRDWVAVIGVDLEKPPGAYTATIEFVSTGDIRSYLEEIVSVAEREFPTTELTVEPGYVELSPDNQARATREAQEIAAIYATLTPERYWSEPFASPLPGTTGGRNFGHRRIFNGQPRAPHSGADLRASTGTPIHASNDGRVVLAKDLFFSGNAVFLDHGLGVYTVYLHLSEIHVEVGDRVARGQVIGLAGATGRVTGPHLHWGVRVLDARVDPFTLMQLESP